MRRFIRRCCFCCLRKYKQPEKNDSLCHKTFHSFKIDFKLGRAFTKVQNSYGRVSPQKRSTKSVPDKSTTINLHLIFLIEWNTELSNVKILCKLPGFEYNMQIILTLGPIEICNNTIDSKSPNFTGNVLLLEWQATAKLDHKSAHLGCSLRIHLYRRRILRSIFKSNLSKMQTLGKAS